MAEPKKSGLSAEAIPRFEEGLLLVLSKWWILQFAVENEWGGPHSRDKALMLASRIFDFFLQPSRKEPLYIDDLEELLYEAMASLNVKLEDGIIADVEEVAEKLMIMHEECLEHNYQSIQKLREVKVVPVSNVRQAGSDSDESMDHDEASKMMVDSPGDLPNPNPAEIRNESSSQLMAEAEDGWVTVTSRKSRGRKI